MLLTSKVLMFFSMLALIGAHVWGRIMNECAFSKVVYATITIVFAYLPLMCL